MAGFELLRDELLPVFAEEGFERLRHMRQLARREVHDEPVALDRVARQRQHREQSGLELEHAGVQRQEGDAEASCTLVLDGLVARHLGADAGSR